MQMTLVIKTRLYTSPTQDKQFTNLSKNYAKACTYTSKVYHDNGSDVGQTALHHMVYRYIRNHYGLKAQEADSVPKTVKARYKSVNTQLSRNVYKYQDKNTGKWYRQYKTVKGLWNPIHFHRPQADLVRKNDWSFTKNKLSVNTLDKRTKCNYHIPECYYKYFRMPHQFGTAKLVKSSGHWYLHISCTITVPSFNVMTQTKDIVGIDRGLRQIYYAYDNHKHSTNLNGYRIMKHRKHYLKQRAVLQGKSSQSAKRKLRKLSGRENCWMTHVNHCASKALVQHYGKRTTFVLEDLRGVRFSTENVPKKHRYTQVSWPFYQLEQMLTYKAYKNQSSVIKIAPDYTSQRCPRCGHVLASSRRHNIHTYICKYCGYKSNDDRIGGMNIRYLGTLVLLSYRSPKIMKNGTITYLVKVHKRSKKTGKSIKATKNIRKVLQAP